MKALDLNTGQFVDMKMSRRTLGTDLVSEQELHATRAGRLVLALLFRLDELEQRLRPFVYTSEPQSTQPVVELVCRREGCGGLMKRIEGGSPPATYVCGNCGRESN